MLTFTLKRNVQMKVYIYEGLSRDSATKAITFANEMPEKDKVYSVKADSGILVVAWPNKDQETDFQFSY